MPRSAALLFAVASLVAAGAFAWTALHPPQPGDPGTGTNGDARTLAALRDVQERLDRIEAEVFQPRLAPTDPAARLADLEARVHELERRTAATAAERRATHGDAGTATGGSSGASQAQEDVHSLSDEDLLRKARTAPKTEGHVEAARYWREILDRRPADALFVEAQLHVGYAHRHAKQHDDAEGAFREALRVAGDDSEQGQWATYQIAWSHHFRGDNRTARETMAGVAAAPATSRTTRGHALLYVAQFSLELGDVDRAREALQTIVREYGDSKAPMDTWLTGRARQMLADLK